MRASYLLFFMTFSVLAQPTPQIQVLPESKSIESFEHVNPGCPENSECDPTMGKQMKSWKDLITKLRDEEIPAEKKSLYIEGFRNKYGIPVDFYTNQKSQQGFKPILFSSACKEHGPKDGEKILRGTAFLKGLSAKKGLVWRDQALIEVPTETLLIPQTVVVYFPEGLRTYSLPLEDQPLFIKDRALHVLREEEGFFYSLKIDPLGEWSVENLDFSNLSQWTDKRQEVKCPVEKKSLAPNDFGTEFCKNVWDEDAKKLVTVKMFLGCST